MNHRSEKHNILHSAKVARFVQGVESLVLHQLTDNFVRYLIAPFVYGRHIYVVDEDGHFSTAGRTVGSAHSLFNVTLKYALKKDYFR